MKYFLIVREEGCYDDYEKHNLFLVSDNIRAQKLIEDLNKLAETYKTFSTELRDWCYKHPRCSTYVPAEIHTTKQAILKDYPVLEKPEALHLLKRKEKQTSEAYQEWHKAFEARMEERKNAVALIEAKYNEQCQQYRDAHDAWYKQYQADQKLFIEQNLPPVIDFSAEVLELSPFISYTDWDNTRFSVEEIELKQ